MSMFNTASEITATRTVCRGFTEAGGGGAQNFRAEVRVPNEVDSSSAPAVSQAVGLDTGLSLSKG